MEKPYIIWTCIVEIHEMDIISINKIMRKESRQTKPKTFVFEVTLKRAVLYGSKKVLFRVFVWGRINFFYKVLTLLGCRSRSSSMQSSMITVPLDVRVVEAFVSMRFECGWTTIALSGIVQFFSGNKVGAAPFPKVPVRLWFPHSYGNASDAAYIK